MTNPLIGVQTYGQSIWMDFIRRGLIESGELKSLVDSGIVGMTSNPTIFAKAIADTDEYDATIAQLIDLDATAIYEPLAGTTLSEAKRLYAVVGRPNVMIKIPGTQEGLPAIEEAIAAGINVNVTLLFSVENYVAVAEAYIRGLERRLAAGLDVSNVASVASFFLSRIDTVVDDALDGQPGAESLQGQAAIASAKSAYARFKDLFEGDRFATLREAGARVQRPLWASTSTKNPNYPDTYYVDTLIGPHTVNTLPPNTVEAFKDHGIVAQTLEVGIGEVDNTLARLAEFGINLTQVTAELQSKGVDSFSADYQRLLDAVAQKREALQTER